ncbi:MAG: hypothetical protein A2W33_06455 [Chloroflexi bacterium RBG_16_52_11]|nr:MAG: hypothetical protein A2W33_06455 [Chloroflexi bacterium RBG_16_52_11]
MEKRYYKIKDLARICGLEEMTIRRAIYRGDLPAVKIGRSVRITEEGFRSYIKPANPHRDGAA